MKTYSPPDPNANCSHADRTRGKNEEIPKKNGSGTRHLFPRNLYGKRAGRPLKKSQKRRLEILLPKVQLDLSQKKIENITNNPCWFEIGFGAGEHLAWQARHNPGVSLIGVEYFINGIAKALEYIEKDELENISLHHGDARNILDILKPASIDRAFILHPDPWPKRRHWRRRLIQIDFIKQLSIAMRPGSELRIATDHADYLVWILSVMQKIPLLKWQAEKGDDWRKRPEDWPQTRYEAKGLREGRPATYLSYRRMP